MAAFTKKLSQVFERDKALWGLLKYENMYWHNLEVDPERLGWLNIFVCLFTYPHHGFFEDHNPPLFFLHSFLAELPFYKIFPAPLTLTPYSSQDTGTCSQILFPIKMSAPHRFCNSESHLFDNNSSSASDMVLKFCTVLL